MGILNKEEIKQMTIGALLMSVILVLWIIIFLAMPIWVYIAYPILILVFLLGFISIAFVEGFTAGKRYVKLRMKKEMDKLILN